MHRFRLFDERTGYRFPDLFEIITLELPKLPPEPDGTALYDWLNLFRARTQEEFTMVAKTRPEIAQAVEVILELSEDDRTRLLAESREKYRRDEEARQEYSYQRGHQEGRLEAHQEGRLEVAKTALRKRIPSEDVASLTGLSLEEVKALAASQPINP